MGKVKLPVYRVLWACEPGSLETNLNNLHEHGYEYIGSTETSDETGAPTGMVIMKLKKEKA